MSASPSDTAIAAPTAVLQPDQIQLCDSHKPLLAESFRLYDYQKSMKSKTYELVRQGFNRILLTVVMGAGKTVLTAYIILDAVSKGRRCVFLVGLNVLLDQTAATLRKLGINCTILQGDRPVDESASVIVASLQTIAARLRRGKTIGELLGYVDLVFVDEAHVAAYHTAYEAIEEHFPDSIFIGLSATPWRLSKKEWLGQKFDDKVEGPQPPEIIKMGGAVPCRGFHIGQVLDLATLTLRNGEYVDSDIAAQACRDEALDHVVGEWQRLCPDRATLMVGATVKQAEMTCNRFNQRGIRAELIVGSTSQEKRLAIFDRVKRGETQVICSVGCLTAGFDLPCISAILYVRATKSKALFHQTAGRGSRPYPGKSDYLLLDFGGNLKRHGNPMGWQNYNINQPQEEEAEAPTKVCPNCSAVVNIFARVCPECGHEFTSEEPAAEQLEALVLQQLNEFVDAFTREKIKNLRRWKKEAYLADRSPDTAIEQFTQEYGHIPSPEWTHHACLTSRYSQQRKAEFINYLGRHCRADNRWGKQWIAHHLQLEFGAVDPSLVPWWEILECDRTASWEEVKHAYCRQAEELHPDRYPGTDAKALMERLNLALEDAREQLQAVQMVGGAA